MHFITATLLSAGLLAAAETCTGPSYGGPQAGNTTVITLNGAGQSGRSFRLRLPGGYDGTSKRPVYWSFHGGGKNASQQESLSSLSDDNYNPDGIAIYPEGEETTQGSGKRYWLSHPGIPQASPNDLDFFLEITGWLDSNICYDTTKVYATGKSNGGGFVNLLACNSTTASKLAAVASVSGAYYMSKQAKACKPNKVIPFLSFHGLNDTTIPYIGKNGGDEDGGDDDDDDSSDVPDFKKTYPITNWTAAWAKRDGVTTLPLNESLYDGLVTRYTWSNSAGVVVQHYKEGNFGHVWPSLYPNLDCPEPSAKCPDGHYVYNATTIILNWFKGYTLSR